jgi:hypothetical protein
VIGVTDQKVAPTRAHLIEQPACFLVRDHNGQQLAYVYFEDEPGRRSAAKLLTSQAVTREEEEDWIATSTERRYY